MLVDSSAFSASAPPIEANTIPPSDAIVIVEERPTMMLVSIFFLRSPQEIASDCTQKRGMPPTPEP
jgi:hypothetical protein